MDSARVVAEAMVRAPTLLPAAATVGHAREAFADDHVHAVLLVDGTRLVSVVERADLTDLAAGTPARDAGRLTGRTTGPAADLAATHRHLLEHGLRRLAVVDGDGGLLGLLCLKASGTGFCSDADVRARDDERRCARVVGN